ncbi:hypothetical protein LTS08_003881 [Lithohypha guttulata]|uniref:uncharacterized protein n=1 Tax=Lithohypha guttulata TaxID=1690604 RepID=UPI002DDEFB1A|nr:hypothetical protein LTR51_001162 [Lithohypha guttulata]KAK5103078.1 hypothetical protein LTS08_003881 [Lithohypha guttulata]
MVNFSPDKDIPDLSGKVILITGANVGLGRESLHQLAKHNPRTIYLAARSKAKADQTIKEINDTLPDTAQSTIRFLECDLTSFDSIKKAAKTFTSESDRLDILMNNAGIMACPEGLTNEGYEVQFGTNHVGHSLLIKLLLPTLQKTAKDAPTGSVRIVNLSSAGEQLAPKPDGIKFDSLKTPNSGGLSTWTRYGQSKLANVLYARALAKRYPEIVSVSVHPGVVQTELTRGPLASYGSWLYYPTKIMAALFCKSVAQGALNQTWAAVAPVAKQEGGQGVKNGTFYHPVGVAGKDSGLAKDEHDVLSDKLWEWTEKELKGQEL